jgi:hypothetical protein
MVFLFTVGIVQAVFDGISFRSADFYKFLYSTLQKKSERDFNCINHERMGETTTTNNKYNKTDYLFFCYNTNNGGGESDEKNGK